MPNLKKIQSEYCLSFGFFKVVISLLENKKKNGLKLQIFKLKCLIYRNFSNSFKTKMLENMLLDNKMGNRVVFFYNLVEIDLRLQIAR
jgi:hypothetical protein